MHVIDGAMQGRPQVRGRGRRTMAHESDVF